MSDTKFLSANLNGADSYTKQQLIVLHSNGVNSLKNLFDRRVITINIIVIKTHK